LQADAQRYTVICEEPLSSERRMLGRPRLLDKPNTAGEIVNFAVLSKRSDQGPAKSCRMAVELRDLRWAIITSSTEAYARPRWL
jgi:hypothetical protein